MSDIKMEDGSILNVPYGATHLLGDYFAKWIDNNSVSIIGNYQGAAWQDTTRAMPRNAIDLSEVNLLREKQKLTARVAELEFSLDDRDCYIADADMKNEEATKRVAELMALVTKSISRLNDCIDQDDAQAYKEAEKFIDIARNALKESE